MKGCCRERRGEGRQMLENGGEENVGEDGKEVSGREMRGREKEKRTEMR